MNLKDKLNDDELAEFEAAMKARQKRLRDERRAATKYGSLLPDDDSERDE